MKTFLLLFFVLTCMTTDLRERKIYNKHVAAGIVCAFIVNAAQQGFLSGLKFSSGGLLAGIVLLFIPFALGVLGAGDVKMLGMIGAFTGAVQVVHVLLAGGVCGGILAVYKMAETRSLLKRLKKLPLEFYCAFFARSSVHLQKLENEKDDLGTVPYGVALAMGVVIMLVLRETGVFPSLLTAQWARYM